MAKWGVDGIAFGMYTGPVNFFHARTGIRYRWENGAKAGIHVQALEGGKYSIGASGYLKIFKKIEVNGWFAGLEGILVPAKSFLLQAGASICFTY
jgi:hypothetical protein